MLPPIAPCAAGSGSSLSPSAPAVLWGAFCRTSELCLPGLQRLASLVSLGGAELAEGPQDISDGGREHPPGLGGWLFLFPSLR